MGPHGAVVPSFRSILQSYVRCSGSASATFFPMIPRNCRNSPGTLSSGLSEAAAVTLGLYRNRSVARIKGNQATSIIHNGIILDLVCGFGGSVGEDVFRSEELSFEWSLYPLFNLESPE